MSSARFPLEGHAGKLAAYRWDGGQARYVALIVHGYGEHMGRYEHVVSRLVEDGAVVYGIDHVGHGRSEGERVLIEDFEPVVADLRLLRDRAVEEHPGLPVVMIGHSMGGLITARYCQLHSDDLACAVLSAPVLGEWAALGALLGMDPIPDVPIDPDTLSRDPKVGAAYAADPLVWHGPFKRATLEGLQRAIETVNAGPALDRLPVLWLHGTDDQLVPYAGTAQGWRAIAGAGDESGTYPGARHEIFNETNRREVLQDVVTFVNRHLTRRPSAPR